MFYATAIFGLYRKCRNRFVLLNLYETRKATEAVINVERPHVFV